MTFNKKEVEALIARLNSDNPVGLKEGIIETMREGASTITAMLEEIDLLDKIATDLQVLCDKQAKELAALKQPVGMEPVESALRRWGCTGANEWRAEVMQAGDELANALRSTAAQLAAVMAENAALKKGNARWGQCLR